MVRVLYGAVVNGAECLLRTARDAGISVCFANPGTTEMPLVAALDSVGGIRPILGLFEGVCTGAADGYARMTGQPALTLLHLGPGFANGIANLHNARRARTPVLNLIGDHATWHLGYDAPLTSDIESLARPVSAWVRTSASAKDLPRDFAEACAAARTAPGRIATLIAPADCQWEPADGPASVPSPTPAARAPADRIEAAAAALRGATRSSLFLGGLGLHEPGLCAAARVAEATGARLVCPTFPTRVDRGAGLPRVNRLPYLPEQAIEFLAGDDALVLAGVAEPVSFFGYEGVPSRLANPEGALRELATPEEDVVAALSDLADALDAPASAAAAADHPLPDPPQGPLDPAGVAAALVRAQPPNAVVMDEAATTGLAAFVSADAAPPHTYLSLTGGAIGQGLPCATGAAVACPDRKVIAFQADGSGLYTLQSLWTQAREGLDVTTLVCANRVYRILQIELGRAGIAEPGPGARALTDLSHPEMSWVDLARGFGVPGVRVDTAEALSAELPRALAEPGPQLIELML